MLAISERLLTDGIDFNFLITSGESHVTRARNNIAATFLNQTDYETLFFIDADIEIEPEGFLDVLAIPGVRGAAVACKTPDRSELLSIWADGKRPTRAEMPSEPFAVDFLGSAVLAIDRDVFERLRASEAVCEYQDPIVGTCWDFFRDYVESGVFLSEDYGLCRLCSAQGIPVVCCPAVQVTHYGAGAWRY